MSYRVATYTALQANLSVANTTMALCRANIGRLPMTSHERDQTIGRIRKQIGELEAMILELTRSDDRRRCSPIIGTVRRSKAGERPTEAAARAQP